MTTQTKSKVAPIPTTDPRWPELLRSVLDTYQDNPTSPLVRVVMIECPGCWGKGAVWGINCRQCSGSGIVRSQEVVR